MNAARTAAPELWGVDFSSVPSTRKPIVLARGQRVGAVVRLLGLETLASWPAFEACLQRPGPWLGGFDLPFGLPRSFVDAQQLGLSCAAVLAAVHARCPTRRQWQACIDDWTAGRPAGQRLPHRATDVQPGARRSTSPLQTRYVPVAYMYYEGLPRLLAAGVSLPGLHPGDPQRVALEVYPGRLAAACLGTRSYKNDASAQRLLARQDLVDALEQGRTPLGLRLKLTPAQAGVLVADASGDRLDAVLCLMQAAWADSQPGWGLPAEVDAVEGWIVGGL